ncbi:MAG: polysaccharide pyruvyl transferase family protein [Bacillota bacterium]
MATGLLKSKVDCSGNLERAIDSLGLNTGNLVFWTAIQRLFKTERVDYNAPQFEGLENVIITDLIWIREADTYPHIERMLDETDIPFIPISVGVQASSTSQRFILQPQVVRLLQKIGERATIGVRGEYTASVLETHGIKNIEVIGCPSMYYWNNPYLRVSGEYGRGALSSNFSTFHIPLKVPEKHFLSYCADRNATFVEQTKHQFMPMHAQDNAYYDYISSWLARKKEIYLSEDMWLAGLKECDFSMGSRFHANVMALRAGKRALFLTSDSRTQEMTSYFQLPTLPITSFDKTKPLEHYFALADYSAFNSNYTVRYDTFRSFCHKNGLQLHALPLEFN